MTLNFFRPPFFLPWLYPNLIWRMEAAANELYLTFDDGPVPGPTEFVLDELRKAEARATFFCIGDNIRKHPEVFRKIIDQGHGVGNHTFNHLSGWKTKKEKYVENISLCQNELLHGAPANFQQPSTRSQLFRPPYGRITRSQIRLLGEYRIIMWDVLTHDYAHSLSEGACLQGAIRATRPGSIVVFHDSYKAEKNMKYALPRYIDHFRNLGFKFRALI